MADKPSNKIDINGKWFKWVLGKIGISIRSLCNIDTGIAWNEKTIRRAVKDGRMSPKLLDDIAQKINVHPDYLRGKYCWTLDIDVMDYDGVRDYWVDNYLDPKYFPYAGFEQEAIDVRKLLSDTLLLHGIDASEYKKLSRDDREKFERGLDEVVCKYISEWFLECRSADYVMYRYVWEWEDEGDVINEMLEYLVERGIIPPEPAPELGSCPSRFRDLRRGSQE